MSAENIFEDPTQIRRSESDAADVAVENDKDDIMTIFYDDFTEEWKASYDERSLHYSEAVNHLRENTPIPTETEQEEPDEFIPKSNLPTRSITGNEAIPFITDEPIPETKKLSMLEGLLKSIYPQIELDKSALEHLVDVINDIGAPLDRNPGMDAIRSVAGTDFRGAIAGGMRDLGQGVIGLSSDVSRVLKIPGLIYNQDGSMEWISADDPRYKTLRPIQLPQIESADEPMAHLVRGMTQFFAGFGALGGMTKGVSLLRNLLAGAGADATFDPEYGNLSTLLREQFNWDNVLVNYLDSKVGKDADALKRLQGRVKTVFEGGGLAAFVPAALLVLRGIKRSPDAIKKVKELIEKETERSLSMTARERQLGMMSWHGTGQKVGEKVGAAEKLPFVGPDNFIRVREWVHVDDLLDIPGNKLGKTDIEKLKKEIIDAGGLKEEILIVVGKNDRTVSVGEGNHRVMAAKELGYKYLPTRAAVQRGTHGSISNPRTDLIPLADEYFPADAKPSDVLRDLRVLDLGKTGEKVGGIGFQSKDDGSVVIDAFHGTFADDLPTAKKLGFGGIHVGTEKAAMERLDYTRPSQHGDRPGGENIIPVQVKLSKPYGTKENPVSETDLHTIVSLKNWSGEGHTGRAIHSIDRLKEQGYDGIIYQNIAEDSGSLSAVAFNRSSISQKVGEKVGAAAQSSEALPSTGLLQGRIIKQYPVEKQTEYQRGMDEITDGFVEEIIGLERVSSVNAPSRYGGHIGESQQIVYKVETTVDADGFTTPTDAAKTQLKQAAAIKGYIQEQDAVVNSFLTPVKDPNLEDAAELYVGRVITHDEMVQADELLGRLGKEHGFDPDDIALPTTTEGVNILNVSFGDIDSETFHVIGDTIAQHFDVGDIRYFKNALLDDGYIGGFSGYQSSQDAYRKIWSETNLGGSESGRQGERWWGHADRIEAKKAEASAYTEGFVKQNPLPRKNIRQIGEESDIRYSERGETLDPKDFSPEAKETLVTRLHDEVVTVLQGGDKEARGWYTSKYQEALDVTSKHVPGLRKSDKTGRRLFTTFIEIASDQADVSTNYSNAVKVWQSYQRTGKVNSVIPTGKASASYRKNLNLLQRLIDGKGPKGVKGLKGAMDWLDETARVGDIEKELGIKLSGYSKNAVLPRQVVFGPKLGIFGANLKGSPQYLTMDRWWSRTFNRLRGTMAPPPTEKSIQSFKTMIGKPRAQKKTVLKEAEKIAKAWAKRGFKNGTPLEKAANTIYKSSIELRDAPINVGDREFQQLVTEDVVSALRNEGWDDMTVADLQAIVWYHEKRRMREHGSRAPIDELDFSDAAKKYWTKK